MGGSNITVFASFFMGMLHALEPGHGKSFFAAYTVGNKLKVKEIIMVIVGMLVAHFATLTIIALLVSIIFNDNSQLPYLSFIGPVIIILFGIYLLYSELKHDHHVHNHGHDDHHHDHHDCSCEQDYSRYKNHHPVIAGVLMGIIPCPSVLAPIMISINYGLLEKLFFILVYVLGMGLVLSLFIIVITLFSDEIGKLTDKFSGKFKPEVISAILIIVIGIVYLIYNLNHIH